MSASPLVFDGESYSHLWWVICQRILGDWWFLWKQGECISCFHQLLKSTPFVFSSLLLPLKLSLHPCFFPFFSLSHTNYFVSESESRSAVSDPFRPHGLYPVRLLSIHGILQVRILKWVTVSFSRDLPNPGIEPGYPALQADSLSPHNWHFILNIIVSNKIWNSKENLISTNFYCLAILPSLSQNISNWRILPDSCTTYSQGLFSQRQCSLIS